MTVDCSSDNDFTSMLLQRNVEGIGLEPVEMRYEDGVWTAEVMPVSGTEEMQLIAVASDDKGNTVSSDPVTVQFELPEIQEDVVITAGVIRAAAEGTNVAVTVKNAAGKAISGTILVAAYRENGQQLEIRTVNIGLASDETKTVLAKLSVSPDEIGSVKAFLFDPSAGFVPQCEAIRINK